MLKRKTSLLLALSVAFMLFFNGQSVIADSSHNNIHTMASILLNLNHFPSDSEKATLRSIVEDSHTSKHESILANAILNLQHSASKADKAKLSTLMNDSSASANARDLASIIHNLSHKPSSADKEKLSKM